MPTSSTEFTASYNIHLYPNPITHSTRIVKVAQSLARLMPYQVVIIGIHEKDLPYEEAVSQSVTIRRLPLVLGPATRNALLKVLQTLEFSRLVVRYCRKLRIALVNVHTLSLLPLGVLLKHLCQATLVYDIHELETEKIHWRGVRRMLARFVEARLISRANRVIVVSPSIAAWYKRRYGVDCEVILNAPPVRSPAVRDRVFHGLFPIPHDQTVLFLYQGSLAAGRSIPLLLQVFAAINRHCIVFVGDGEYGDMVRQAASRCRNIFYHRAVPPDALPRLTASADVGLVLVESVCESYRCALPTKFFDYLAAGIPVVASAGVDMKRIVEQYGVGLVLEDLAPENVASCLAALNPQSLAVYRQNVPAAARHFTWEAEERKLKRLYDGLLARPRRAPVPEGPVHCPR